ncbi:TPA: XRE family transcriptional regulator [Clostridioides difficile]|nr:XRE family transcriptional regulator [Clostridioides difficile]HEK4599477.1 XRE family transcriptional regulator [Clostridioides difficile]HEK4658361.1 XRE family transcriptional regulator [Clostridioides difficile]
MFNNLKAEMARFDIKSSDVAKVLGVTNRAISCKFTGKTEFTRIEMFKIRKELFPNHSLDYLFSDKPMMYNAQENVDRSKFKNFK